MKIGFLSNQLDNRGTGNALFNYAYYNDIILNNKSAIFTFAGEGNDPAAFQLFSKVFGGVNIIEGPQDVKGVDALYHIKSGEYDGFDYSDNPYLVHSVFANVPHGTRYATISRWMGNRFNLPFVPHIVDLPSTDEDLRERLGIPEYATVFGRYGGRDSFDISWAWTAINSALEARSDYYFLFMNTDVPAVDFYDPSRVIFMAPTVIPAYKRIFINTCDAMIHARSRGETFGLAVGEFANCGVPVFTYELSPEKAHIDELREWGIYYEDETSLFMQMISFERGQMTPWLYSEYTPEKVMLKFEKVFLDGLD